jgi:phenylpropionate dioxygenase-like ring-hydroxylating dioxygenase large terminal subunit
MVEPPSPSRFPAAPASWYLLCRAADLRPGPLARDLLDRRLVAYRPASGPPVVLDGRCSHLGADLGLGCVVGDALQCPFHHWQYGPDGRCRHIPAGDTPPPTARQRRYPALERHGLVWFFNGERPLFDLPFFPDVAADELVPARPFGAVLRCPWYMVGANGFDAQHFRAAHDRQLVSEPVITCPHPFARRASATFAVAGTSLRDRLTRRFAGDRVTLSMDDWCGNLLLVTAHFRRTRSFGLVATWPLGPDRTAVQVIVWVRRSRSRAGRWLFDPLSLAVRRLFIRQFLMGDARLAMAGLRYNPHGLSASDTELAAYWRWLAAVAHGTPAPPEESVDSPSPLAVATTPKELP